MIPLRAIPSLLVSITVLAVVAWISMVGWTSGSLYAEELARHDRAAAAVAN
jgi:hypothetical protein